MSIYGLAFSLYLLEVLYRALPFQTCLQSLILTGNDIGFAGAKTLAKGMKEMSSLQILNLSNNAITAAGISSLCASWPSDNQIMDLNLSRNPLTMSDKTYQEFDNEGFHRLDRSYFTQQNVLAFASLVRILLSRICL